MIGSERCMIHHVDLRGYSDPDVSALESDVMMCFGPAVKRGNEHG